MAVRTYIGLGGNIGSVSETLTSALQTIAGLPGTRVVNCSGLYASPAWGGVPQPDYLNAVVAIDTELSAADLLRALLEIERQHGRNRDVGERWGPRTLDCDILLYGMMEIDADDLQIPHPRLTERAFVVLPLYELCENLTIPGKGDLMPYLKHFTDSPIRRVAEGPLNVQQSSQ